ncbi:MAG: hypothetical protein EOP51_20310 [Sphingobacteriales bacterium]|nr:MAG: hypothetical protein EOP51_20310 [Sphingobacteriales bacterium]
MMELEKLMEKQIAGINDMERKNDAAALQQATIQPQANTAVIKENNRAAIDRAQYELQQMTSRWNLLQQNMQQLNNLCDAGGKGLIQFSPVLLENQRCKLLEQMKRCDMTAQQAVRNKIAALENRFNEL